MKDNAAGHSPAIKKLIQTAKSQPETPDTGSVIKKFMQVTNTKEVYLFGGAAIDRYMNHNAKIMDYDIAISDPKQYTQAINKLRTLGFDVGKPRIVHTLSTVAKHPDYGVFDISCMDIANNGIYNLEKFYIHYSPDHPDGQAVDRYGTVRALREGRVEIVNNPDEEPAYYLLRRFAVLSGKYNLPLSRNGINKPTIDIIERRLQETPLSKNNEHDRVRCLSRFLGAIFRAKDRTKYLEGMGETGLMRFAFPEIDNLLHDKSFTRNPETRHCKTKFDLIQVMFDRTKNKDALTDDLSILSKREPDREEAKLINTVNSLINAPASKKRIENLINPVFVHILQHQKSK